MEIILASNSPRRKQLLEEAGFSLEIIPADIDETFEQDLDVYQNVCNTSYKKASKIAEKRTDKVIVAADTIVVLDGVVFGKPRDEMDAFRMLSELNGHTHEVITGVSIIKGEKKDNFYVVSEVTFKQVSDEELWEYIKTKEPLDKAGAYAIQGLGRNLILEYEGSLENIIGLPVDEVIEAIKNIEK